jgi:hypothetical protein
MTINSNNITINPNNITINPNNITTNNKKFTDIYNKIVHDIESLKSFYFNRYILELEFGTLNFILGELIVSTLNLYHVIIAIKKEERDILVKSINELRIIVNKLVLLIVISFNDDNKEDNNDDFICNNEEYNLNFFNPNKENCNTIKIISTKFKIITQHIEDIKKNNNVVIDNIKINILFNKIKNNLDTINELYFQQPLPPLTNPQQTLPPQPQPQPLSKKYNINITFKEFCLLNSKNKIKVVIKMMVNIIKNIDYKEVNFYNIALFSFLFFLCFY